MSTFGSLNTALSGLNAARAAMEVAGNNLANVATPGYTRQRAEFQSAGAVASTGKITSSGRIDQGVVFTGIARLADASLDARVRGTVALASQSSVRADAMADLESILREPGENGLSALLNDFWAGWEDVAGQPGDAAAGAVLLQRAQSAVDRIVQMDDEINGQWTSQRQDLSTRIDDLNATAQGVAALNGQIRSLTAAGGSPAALLDQRSQLVERLAELSGASVRELPDGTVDVLLEGSPLVTGTTARSLQLSGGRNSEDAAVSVRWSHRPDDQVSLDAGSIAAGLAVLSPATGSYSSGPLAQAAAQLDRIALRLAEAVNQVHHSGLTSAGTPGGDFFGIDPANPAGSIKVLLHDGSQLATGLPGGGALDGSNAQKLAELGKAPDGADALWSRLVIEVGTTSRAEATQALSSAMAADGAVTARHGASAVSLDEENIALLSHQHAYQGAARVLTALDEMLDTLINGTGRVGR